MPLENVERVRRAVEAINGGNLDAALAELHPDIEWRTLDLFPDAGTYRGPEGVAELFKTWQGTFRGFQLHLEDCTQLDDDQVLAVLRVSGEGASSGAVVQSPAFSMLFEAHEGLLIRARMFQTSGEALEAAGLTE